MRKQQTQYQHSKELPNIKEALEFPAIDSKSAYKQALKYWQNELLHVQQAYYHQGQRAVIVFEGWDGAGKGGAIRRITEKLDPRGYQVFPIGPPTDDEQGRHYLYRFFNKLPKPGTLTIFDRSYYGRVLVERIEGYASDSAWHRAYKEINDFEQLLLDDNIKVIKLFLHISSDEQLKRFSERLNNPYKRWKLTTEDIRNRSKRADYEVAIDEMLYKTNTEQAPWNVILADHKWYTRVEILKYITHALSDNMVIAPPPIDPKVVELAEHQLGIKQRGCKYEP
ncbi:polyphosphate kinase 2 family protein [Pseudoalteromonas luteoviolacea]|uniref:polyphosphate kinase 2 family protein n=1 Tax=Pseudoalteromonas luteoviolacea TaxID=43657 RepID=UPI0011513272|nr:polyphosphate kinase [Pseudoalteromonas luteoviolacea]TQF67444.1 polyphosphate kinase [Pseudoalteromonas luteoviolacea]